MEKMIVFMPHSDYYRYPYWDIALQEDIQVIEFGSHGPFDYRKRIVPQIFRIHTSPKVNKIIHLPFQSIWYKSFTPISDTFEPIIFWYWGCYSVVQTGYRKYLKQHFPNCKILFSMFDIAESYRNPGIIDRLRNFADAISTYDKEEAKKFGFYYHRSAYTKLPSNLLKSNFPQYDLTFIGLAKDRSDTILSVYQAAKEHRVLCDFNILGLSEDEVERYPEFRRAKYIPYLTYLQRIQHTNCLLEICQKNATSHTFRTWEAIAYGKKILTNNNEFLNDEFYHPEYIQIFDSVDDIDWDWVERRVPVDYQYIQELSVKKFVQDFRDEMEESNGNQRSKSL